MYTTEIIQRTKKNILLPEWNKANVPMKRAKLFNSSLEARTPEYLKT